MLCVCIYICILTIYVSIQDYFLTEVAMFTAMAISHFLTTVLKLFETLQLSTLLLSGLPKFEVRGENIINQVVEVVSLDEPLALVAGVHGCPAELILRSLPLHEAPDRLPHYWYWLHVWPKE